MFFSIDGGDGTGKSTQGKLLRNWLAELGHNVVACRDPGSTPLGEAVRDLLLNRHDLPAKCNFTRSGISSRLRKDGIPRPNRAPV